MEFFLQRSQSPALLFSSHRDQIGTEAFSRRVAETWMKRGVQVTSKCFESSEHVRHIQKYPEEYLKLLHDHWTRVNLLGQN
jgi:Eukaryotic protein of unknown function (DUF829)